jgi:hypothetical protein
MEQVDAIFKTIAAARSAGETVIACLYTGETPPSACTSMPRDPKPQTGMLFDETLHLLLNTAVNANQAVHDGAIMIGRVDSASPYRITGWSYRLFPPELGTPSEQNRGSAFHSCLAMSGEPEVDVMFLVSGGRAYRFDRGICLII